MKSLFCIVSLIVANCLGQTGNYKQESKFKAVTNIDDYENITIINSVNESAGLFKIGHVGASTRGDKLFTSKENLEKKTFTKLKMIGALMGASVIRISNMLIAKKEDSFDRNETKDLAGTAYSLTPLDFDAFAKLLAGKSEYISVSEIELSNNSVKFSKRDKAIKLNVTSLKKDDYAIIITGKLHGDNGNYQVVSFDSESFDIFYMDAKASYRIKFKL